MSEFISKINDNGKDYIIRDAAAAPIESPNLRGVPTAPTAAQETKNDQIATTAFVHGLVNNNIDSKLGNPGGIATLDENGNIPSSQLPSYVDDVLDGTYDKENDQFLKLNGEIYSPESSKIYIDVNTRVTYRWTGTTYAEIASSLALGTTAATAFPGNRGLALEQEVAALSQGSVTYRGTIGIDGDITELPTTYKRGDMYRVATEGTYSEQECEVGDFLFCTRDNILTVATLPGYDTKYFKRYVIYQKYNPQTGANGEIIFAAYSFRTYGTTHLNRAYYDIKNGVKQLYSPDSFNVYYHSTTDNGVTWTALNHHYGDAKDAIFIETETEAMRILNTVEEIYNNENAIIYSPNPWGLSGYATDWAVIQGNLEDMIGEGAIYIDPDETSTEIENIDSVTSAKYVSYSNADSGLEATNTQEAIDKTNEKINNLVISGGNVIYELEQTETSINLKGSDNSISKVNIDDTLSLSSTNPIQNKIVTQKLEEVFQSVSDGKEKIASAITDKGIYTDSDATFETMSTNISQIKTGGNEFNIYFGENEPADTDKLWIKHDEPNSYLITNKITTSENFDNNFNKMLPSYDRYSEGIVTVGDKIYLIGGYHWLNGSGALSDILEFDTKTETFSVSDIKLPNAASDLVAEVYGTDIYCFSAYSYFKINLLTRQCTKVSIPTGSPGVRSLPAHTIVGNKIYFFGGATGTFLDDDSRDIVIFDILTETFTKLSTELPSGRYSFPACLIGTNIYLFGGTNGPDNINKLSGNDDIFCFDTITNTIKILDVKLPRSLYGIGASIIENNIYLFGGTYRLSSGDYGSTSIYKFLPETKELITLDEKLPIQIQRQMPVATANNTIYIMGGYETQNVYKFIIQPNIPYNELLITSTLNKNIFNIINGDTVKMELGVNNIYIGNSENLGESVDGYLYRQYVQYGYSDERFTSNFEVLETGIDLTNTIQCNIGNLLIASIMARDALTLSDGWILISTSEINSADTTNQTLSFAYKYAENTIESLTVTQASEQRMIINIVALQGATGFIDNGYTYENDTSIGSITTTNPEGLTLFACTAPIWGAHSWAASNYAYLTQPTEANRLMISLDQSEDTEVTFSTGGVSTPITCGSLTILGMDKFYDYNKITEGWSSIHSIIKEV